MNKNLLVFMLKNSLDENKEIVKNNNKKVIEIGNKMVAYSKFATIPITIRVDE